MFAVTENTIQPALRPTSETANTEREKKAAGSFSGIQLPTGKREYAPSIFLNPYSGSVGSLNNTVSLMLPCPYCGKLALVGSAGSNVDAVSSGGNSTSEFRNMIRLP